MSAIHMDDGGGAECGFAEEEDEEAAEAEEQQEKQGGVAVAKAAANVHEDDDAALCHAASDDDVHDDEARDVPRAEGQALVHGHDAATGLDALSHHDDDEVREVGERELLQHRHRVEAHASPISSDSSTTRRHVLHVHPPGAVMSRVSSAATAASLAPGSPLLDASLAAVTTTATTTTAAAAAPRSWAPSFSAVLQMHTTTTTKTSASDSSSPSAPRRVNGGGNASANVSEGFVGGSGPGGPGGAHAYAAARRGLRGRGKWK
jgi:hypothetical protein